MNRGKQTEKCRRPFSGIQGCHAENRRGKRDRYRGVQVARSTRRASVGHAKIRFLRLVSETWKLVGCSSNTDEGGLGSDRPLEVVISGNETSC